MEAKTSSNVKPWPLWRVIASVVALTITSIGGTFYVYPRGMLAFSAGLVDWTSGSTIRTMLGVALVCLFSAFLWFIRETQRTAYGALECGFALHVAWFVLSNPSTSPGATGGTLLGAIYVLIRGVENFRDGWRAQKEAEKAKSAEPTAPV